MQTPPPTPHKFRLKRLYWVLLCLTAMIGLGLWGNTYFFSPLPRGAYPVAATTWWIEHKHAPFGSPKYCWLPNGDVSFLERNTQGFPQVCFQKIEANGTAGPVRYGPVLPPAMWFRTVFPSPDERWVAYTRNISWTDYQTVVISADGRSKSTSTELFSGWLSDSRSFLALSFAPPQPSLKVHHLDSQRIETVPALATDWTFPIQLTMFADSPQFLIGGAFNRPMPGKNESTNYPKMTIRACSISQPYSAPQTWQASVPDDARFGSAVASPDNKHLLWVTFSYKPTLLNRWIHRLIPNKPLVASQSISCFITDLHGSHRHAVLEGGLNRWAFIEPIWTPDSKHLSFLYNNKLYLIPVE